MDDSCDPGIEDSTTSDDVAVIGMACRFPGANNYREFWQNLINKKSSITEIPSDRWNWRDCNEDSQKETNKVVSKWGGFIDDIDNFDAKFFLVSRKEAELMDPQQRIMLELTWGCIEDAGYKATDLRGSKMGVFIGVCNYDYKEIQERYGQHKIGYSLTGNALTMLPNKISHFFDFHGPSITVDTACSSSLYSVIQAMQSIRIGDSDLAVAGGVNYMGTETRHLALNGIGVISPGRKCMSFDKSADGYVRGEGAGLIILKRLEKAVSDGDRIHCVIKGGAMNHGGKAKSITSPNSFSQARVLDMAYRDAKVRPETITHIEAHGTGTPLGDPMEILGLSRCYRKNKNKKAYCGIGTVKTNIGHLESAAGIAGIIKATLSLKNEILIPLQDFKNLNPKIKLKESPFYLVTEKKRWVRLKDDKGETIPLRVGVSSFGFGGANAHVVLQEYKVKKISQATENTSSNVIVPMSAKSKSSLKAYVRNLLKCVREDNGIDLVDIAYTYQVAREEMDERLVIIAHDLDSLCTSADGYMKEVSIDGVYSGSIKHRNNKPDALLRGESEENIGNLINKNNLDEIAKLWVSGACINWKLLHGDRRPLIKSLPTYPFSKERYWVKKQLANRLTSNELNTDSLIHPLIHQNISDFSAQKYKSKFNGKEIYFRNLINDEKAMFNSAYLEMAYVAIVDAVKSLKNEKETVQLIDISWHTSQAMQNQNITLYTSLLVEESRNLTFQVSSKPNGFHAHDEIYCSGSARISSMPHRPEKIDLESIFEKCGNKKLDADKFYSACEKIGGNDFPSKNTVTPVYFGDNQYLVELRLPNSISDIQNEVIADLCILESTLQVAIKLFCFSNDVMCASSELLSLDNYERLKKCSSTMWALITYRHNRMNSTGMVFDIDLIDSQDEICIRGRGLTYRSITTAVDVMKVSNTASNKPNNISLVPLPDSITATAYTEATLGMNTHVKGTQKNECTECASPVLSLSIDIIQSDLIEMLAEIFDVDKKQVTCDDAFNDLGLDSINSIEWITAIKEKYGLSIALKDVYNNPNIRLFAQYLETKIGEIKARQTP